jgi:hypothetical protein
MTSNACAILIFGAFLHMSESAWQKIPGAAAEIAGWRNV